MVTEGHVKTAKRQVVKIAGSAKVAKVNETKEKKWRAQVPEHRRMTPGRKAWNFSGGR